MPNQVTNVASDDALTTIYRITHDEKCEVIAARLAERLDITGASMSAMLRRLERDEFVRVDDRKRISLTTRGLARAEEMIRRHRLAECLLVDVLGLEWWRAYDEAHLLEHAISPITEPLIRDYLGAPSHSPFGYPIPGLCASLETPGSTIADIAAGASAEVARVFEEDQELLHFFDEAGVRPGVIVEVTSHSPASGTLCLSVAGRSVVIGYPAARRVLIRPLGPAHSRHLDLRVHGGPPGADHAGHSPTLR